MTEGDGRGTAKPVGSSDRTILAGEPPSRRERWARLALLAVWLAAVLYLAAHHVPWRDEVRALSIALQGDSLIDMLRGLQGEGHPALWYLLLRGAHELVPVREVLPVMALLIAAGAMALLALRAPLRLPVIALIMFGGLGLFEYAVSARNYGMTMLVLFAVAALYPKRRDAGVLMGLLLALLCNTNVPANFLAAALLGFWLVELIGEEGLRWTRKHTLWAINAAIAAAGAAICFLTVYPTVNDAAVTQHAGGITGGRLVQALTTPASSFPELGAPFLLGAAVAPALLTILLIGSLIGLVRAPAAFLAGLGVLLVFQLFFQLVYPGGYRHQGLLLVFLATLYWLVAAGRGGRWPERWRTGRLAGLARIGGILFAMLLALQLTMSYRHVAATVKGVPYSRAADLAALLERERLQDAVLIADPDVMLEPLPYFADNPIYLLREQRFGNVVRFTREARTDLTLGDVLADAQRLGASTGRPVVIVLRLRLRANAPPVRVRSPYVGSFSTSPEQVRRFLAAARPLATLRGAVMDETYDVYVLRPPTGG